MLGENPILCIPTDYPRQDIKRTPTPIADFTLIPEEFIQKFYFCEYGIFERERAIPHIEWLIEQLKPHATSANSKAYQELATLQFIYICLTQLHFHKTCPCQATFRGQPYKLHNYYDHLYQQAIVITQGKIGFNLTASSARDEEELLYQLIIRGKSNFQKEFCLGASIALTLSPWYWLIGQQSAKRGEREKAYDAQEEAFTNLFDYTQTGAQLYVRHATKLIPLQAGQSTALLRLEYGRGVHTGSLANFDFRGCEFQNASFAWTTSMRNLDGRYSTWDYCDLPFSVDLTGSSFNNSYFHSTCKSPSILCTSREANRCYLFRPRFPLYTNNSCFFKMQTSSMVAFI